jgi:hypothetical protein
MLKKFKAILNFIQGLKSKTKRIKTIFKETKLNEEKKSLSKILFLSVVMKKVLPTAQNLIFKG